MTVRPAISEAACRAETKMRGELADVLEAFLADLERGAPPNEQALLAAHPQLADELPAYFDSLRLLHTATRRSKSPSASSSQQSVRRADFFQSVARLAKEAAEALAHAHEFGIIHRDIKPSNLLLDERGKLWVTDFGLARIQADSGVTLTGDVVGTLRYMSPEQAAGRSALVDQRTDVYSLGVTLYEFLTQSPAHGGEDRQTLLRQVVTEEPLAPRRLNPAIPIDLETIVMAAMAKSREDRYASAQALADDLASGFTPLGVVEHDTLVNRSVQIGDLLFAISSDSVSVHPLTDPTQQLGKVTIADESETQAPDPLQTPIPIFPLEPIGVAPIGIIQWELARPIGLQPVGPNPKPLAPAQPDGERLKSSAPQFVQATSRPSLGPDSNPSASPIGSNEAVIDQLDSPTPLKADPIRIDALMDQIGQVPHSQARRQASDAVLNCDLVGSRL